MANEGERPTSADKGKGKADKVVDGKQTDKNAENSAKPLADANKKDGDAAQDGTWRQHFPQYIKTQHVVPTFKMPETIH